MTLLALLVWLALSEEARSTAPGAAALRLPALLAGAVLVVQIALGGWVSTNYAVMACPDFPLCQGRFAPPDMDFGNGFTIWRDLGMTGGETAVPIPFQALVAIHWTHRTFAYVAFAVLGWLAWRASKVDATRKAARAIGALLALQFATGLSNVVLQWPLLLAVLHNGGAALLLALVVAVNYRAWQAARAPVPTAAAVTRLTRGAG
jgi:cytochrome c oxidase assembly protein subunit 15